MKNTDTKVIGAPEIRNLTPAEQQKMHFQALDAIGAFTSLVSPPNDMQHQQSAIRELVKVAELMITGLDAPVDDSQPLTREQEHALVTIQKLFESKGECPLDSSKLH